MLIGLHFLCTFHENLHQGLHGSEGLMGNTSWRGPGSEPLTSAWVGRWGGVAVTHMRSAQRPSHGSRPRFSQRERETLSKWNLCREPDMKATPPSKKWKGISSCPFDQRLAREGLLPGSLVPPSCDHVPRISSVNLMSPTVNGITKRTF